jgi:16S rRNA A1518/A1519 N6-dimethyltransferase RsmA/KsgA/DIM1 with predicted DNA glycosylase/AP lyase activity
MLIGGSIVWSTLALGISPMPSSKKARKAMLQLVHETEMETGNGAIFELGSGWGNLLIPLAEAYPQRRIVGYELSFIPWLTTVVLKKILGLTNIQVLRQNFLHADLNSASIILCYLFPGGMQGIQNKLDSKTGKLEYLISNNFSLPSHKPSKIIELNDLYKSPIYSYKFKGSE